MGLYNFKKQFVPFILSGKKTHTIRATRKHPDRPGNTMHLYSGLRTKHTQLLMRVRCTRIEPIMIDRFGLSGKRPFVIQIHGQTLDQTEMESLARRDGFKDLADMAAFWPDDRLPFYGHIIHWESPCLTKL